MHNFSNDAQDVRADSYGAFTSTGHRESLGGSVSGQTDALSLLAAVINLSSFTRSSRFVISHRRRRLPKQAGGPLTELSETHLVSWRFRDVLTLSGKGPL